MVTDPVPARPKNVVMVDAENPMVEVHGEFFRREDHDQILAAARQEAYRDGYTTGWNAAAARASTNSAGAQQVVLRWRRPLLQRILLRGASFLVLLIFAASILLTLLGYLRRIG